MKPKEADFWVTKSNGIMCVLCPHNCFLLNGETGRCRTRKNINGKLISLVYGYPCTIQIDPIEKKPLYHFLPGTSSLSTSTIGCNLRCFNCQNYHISQSSFKKEEAQYVSPFTLVEMAIDSQCKSISYTYTDPIVYYEYARDTAIIAHEKGLKNVMISAGYINKKPLRDLCAYMDAANIDLKSFDDKIYQKLSQVRLKPVLNTLEILMRQRVWLEITNLIIPEYTDDMKMIKLMCRWLVNNGFSEVPLHFSRFHASYKLSHLPSTPIDVLNKAYEIAKEIGIQYVYIGNVNQKATNQTYCPNCNETIVSRSGYYINDISLNGNQCEKCGCEISGVWK